MSLRHIQPNQKTNQHFRKKIIMKTIIKNLLVIACAFTIASTSSYAQIYTLDENGNSSGPGISPGILQPDPSGGVAPAPVLVYTLPFAAITGDVVLIEPGSPANGQFSDVVRFWNPTGVNATQVIFYSDVSTTDPGDSLADAGLPVNLINPVFINEVGPEGNNGAIYTPPPGGPGSIAGAVGLQYNIISDVPEPGALALAVLGGGTLLLTARRRQTTK